MLTKIQCPARLLPSVSRLAPSFYKQAVYFQSGLLHGGLIHPPFADGQAAAEGDSDVSSQRLVGRRALGDLLGPQI
jgi:hypothetical protein